jgi:hypothetical protein
MIVPMFFELRMMVIDWISYGQREDRHEVISASIENTIQSREEKRAEWCNVRNVDKGIPTDPDSATGVAPLLKGQIN